MFFFNELISDPKNPSITPIQGPIFIKNGSVPVVPLLSYPTMNNGTFIRIPVSNANGINCFLFDFFFVSLKKGHKAINKSKYSRIKFGTRIPFF